MTVKQAFQRTTPEAVGIPSKAIEGFLNNVRNSNIELHSLMILRHGKVCAEGWWEPYAPDKLHNVHSFTKTFVASAAGILVHEGKLSLDQTVISFFPEDAPEAPSENLKKMTVHHLLSMSTGHHDEPAIRSEKNFIKAFLAWPVEHEPGTWFRYNSNATHMVGRIIHKITGKTFVELLQERMFEPMGFGKVECSLASDGFPSGGGGFALTTEDMCRLAQLYLNGGKWNGQQIVPEEWIRTATVPQCDNSNGTHRDGNEDWEAGYGYQMWMDAPAHSYRFDGAFGQEALVCPDQDLAVVFTASTLDLGNLFRLVWRFILDQVHDAPLPENPSAWSQLNSELQNLKLNELKIDGTSWLRDKANKQKLCLAPNVAIPFSHTSFAVSSRENSDVRSLTPEFGDGIMKLSLEMPEETMELEAGMDGHARPNLITVDGKEMEVYVSAKWTAQNVLSVSWRTLRVVQCVKIDITYGLTDAKVSVSRTPRNGEPVIVNGTYACS